MEKEVGRVTQYDAHRSMAEAKLSDTLHVGEAIHIKGPESDWRQSVEIIYINGKRVIKAWAGQLIWLTVIKQAYKDDKIFVLVEPSKPLPSPKPKPKPKPEPKPKPKPKPNQPKHPELEPPEYDEPDLPDPNDFPNDENKKKKEKERGEGG